MAKHNGGTPTTSLQRMPANSPGPQESKYAKPFPPRRDFASLSVRDLLDAREAYHVQLSSMANVVATAVGRYLIHKDDWYATHPPDTPRPQGMPAGGHVRTLSNSVVRPWSWPAVLVFVREWSSLGNLGRDAIPSRLYLPDGREVPTCVVLATPDETLPPPAPGPANASELLGGGYMLLRNGQGSQQAGTVGCLVQREGSFFALTNKHVAGAKGEPVLAVVGDTAEAVGIADGLFVAKRTLASLFEGWPGERTFVNLDAGLVHVTDVSRWTAQVFGIGEVGEVFDATSNSVTLDLIGLPLRAFGAASGPIEGEIRGLFFRYQSLGNYDYVADLLIGPRGPELDPRSNEWLEPTGDSGSIAAAPQTRPGDSGTLWFYDPRSAEAERGERARRLRPLAMQWGGERIQENGKITAYALATFLSNVCRVLDVEIVRDWSVGWSEYWGKIGHFAIGWKACTSDLLADAKLAKLMKENQERVGFGEDTLDQGAAFKMGRDGFVPLADVPDYVWVPAARGSGPRQHEPQQHFADVDLPPFGEPADSDDFLARCVADPSLVTPKSWNDFFAAFAEKGTGPEEGSLPFRVAQIFDEMVGFAREKDSKSFVAAAGILAHYVGDASQPLHCSYLHHGELPMMNVEGDDRAYPVAHGSDEFKQYSKTAAAKIHGIYEEGMLEIDPATLLAQVDTVLGETPMSSGDIPDGTAAAVETVLLMDRARKRLAPKIIIDADDPSLGPKPRAKRLWADADIQKATAESLADSVQVLARIWQAAWEAGNGASIPASSIRDFDEKELEALYRSGDFLVPMTLAQMARQQGNVTGPSAPKRARPNKRAAATATRGSSRRPRA
jgi:hypothetical protein